jgi:hypothetical protein
MIGFIKCGTTALYDSEYYMKGENNTAPKALLALSECGQDYFSVKQFLLTQISCQNSGGGDKNAQRAIPVYIRSF